LQQRNRRRDEAIQTGWYGARNELIQQTSKVTRRGIRDKLSTFDIRREINPNKVAVDVPAEANGVLEVHLADLSRDVEETEWLGPRGPVCGDAFWDACPSAVWLLLGAETGIKVSKGEIGDAI